MIDGGALPYYYSQYIHTKACTLTGIFDASFTSEVIVKAGRSGTVVFIQFVGQEARDEFVRRFQLQHRGQDEHFGKIKTPDAEEVKAANARSGAAFDRAHRPEDEHNE